MSCLPPTAYLTTSLTLLFINPPLLFFLLLLLSPSSTLHQVLVTSIRSAADFDTILPRRTIHDSAAMIVDPMQAVAAGKLPIATSSVVPQPTIIPVPSKEFQSASETGTRTLWVVFVIMLVSAIGFTGMAWRVPNSKRLYHVVTTLIVVFAALSYFAMASGAGSSYHHIRITEKHKTVPDTHLDIYRQVFWARYVDWSITTPLLLLDLGLLAGMNGGNLFVTIIADIIMVLTGLFAAFGTEGTSQKWGWYTIACFAYLVVLYKLVVSGRATARAKGGKVANFYNAIGGFTIILWTIYPIVWGVADGSRKLGVDEEIIAYAVLDVLAKPVFGLWLLWTHASIPETNIDLGGFWTHGLSSEGALRVGDDEDGA
ncbi:Hypothetical protein R9X50_00089800 [Acrodontium crateriforme]|uniref:Opsin-1 n=1 Tax=Acrodontium crateriforme TaxID=150365 RepID=A0AAQ3LYP5_9PEZI|nr:Hypothetical protein R9X50_00089800 [Acrodontium crateriforme]